MKHLWFIPAALTIILSACGNNNSKNGGKEYDTPTTGTLKLYVDEGYKPIVSSSIDVFDSIYRRAKIIPTYCSEGDAVNALLNDSVETIIITRLLNEKELSFFKNRGWEPKVTPIAYDAVVFIVNPENADTALTVDQIREITTGKATKWSQIDPKSKLGDIVLVFDNPTSGTLSYVRDSIGGGAPIATNATALKVNEEVINYVGKHKNAIGIIAGNWISDTDDKGVQHFLKQINIVDVAKQAGDKAWGPYQAYMQLGRYPFRRTVYFINGQPRQGLGLGFASYLAGPDGQRIVLKDGLLPATFPPRLINASRN